MSAGQIDVMTIFPDYFTTLAVSLIGKARDAGALAINVHDLRDWTADRHRTVDDTPAGGGAGMVMRADIWGKALDDVLTAPESILIIPTPGGQPFSQEIAQEFANEVAAGGQLVIACGRYEGIDSRVSAHYGGCGRVREISIGDYVLNGGESAAMVMIEAIGRLVPGVVGNPESLVEESHSGDGLLEYPVYTAPADWRGLPIPAVLRSGDHAKIAQWRKTQALRRTAYVRPDLLSGRGVNVRRGKAGDAQRLHDVAAETFPLACPPGFPPEEAVAFVTQNLSIEQFRSWAKSRSTILLVAEIEGIVIGYAVVLLRHVSAELPEQQQAATAHLSKMYVLPEHHGSGASGALMSRVLEDAARAGMNTIWLGVNQHNERAQKFYSRHGWEIGTTRRFVVGGQEHDDFVMVRTLDFVNRE